MSICVLVTAEIIAQSYYPALRQATNDPVLRRLCDQIILDEEAHVAFQTERIASLRKSASSVRRKLSELMQRFLFFGTLVVVWIQHGSVFIRAGFTFSRYWKDCWMYYRRAEAGARHPEYRTQNQKPETTPVDAVCSASRTTSSPRDVSDDRSPRNDATKNTVTPH